MVAETAALSKGLQAFREGEWALTGIFAEVVTQITALFENRTTARVATFEVKLTRMVSGFRTLIVNAMIWEFPQRSSTLFAFYFALNICCSKPGWLLRLLLVVRARS